MKRKVVGITLGTLLLALSMPVEAQHAGKVYRIGYLASRVYPIRTNAFRQGLRELGYVEGQNIVIEYRFAGGKRSRFPDLAAELVRLNLDVIFAYSTPAVRALKKATTTIPLVTVSGDPVRAGFMTSLARPGGNITGLANLTPELAGKRLELLKEVIPQISRVAVLWNPDGAIAGLRMRETKTAAKSLDIVLQPVAVRRPNDFEPGFSAMIKGHAGALFPLRDTLVQAQLKQIIELAAKNRLPGMYDHRRFVEFGGLISYGTLIEDLDRRAAKYVDRVLKGAKPGDLPVQQPTKFELFINMKRAKKLGLTIPPEVLYRADKVIK